MSMHFETKITMASRICISIYILFTSCNNSRKILKEAPKPVITHARQTMPAPACFKSLESKYKMFSGGKMNLRAKQWLSYV